jgi:transposase-like protein
MVAAVRAGAPLRSVARTHGVALATVQRWVARAAETRLDRVDWSDRPDTPHRTTRTDPAVEDCVLRLRWELREASILGEYGARAIRAALVDQADLPGPVPSLRTIGRILDRHDMLDRRRRRRPAPPAGWYLPDLRERQVELDSFDTIEGLRLQGGPDISVLTGISLHGGLAAAWPERSITVQRTILALARALARIGLPGYAQFDNGGLFVGSTSTTDAIGGVIRACLAIGVTPVFAPPRESGFQAAIESLNGRWQAKLWNRFADATLEDLQARSAAYIIASRRRAAARIEAAPARRPFPTEGVDLDRPPIGRLVFLRRTTDSGRVSVLGHHLPVDQHWLHRLVRAEIDLDLGRVRIYALRRREPEEQPLIAELAYQPPSRWYR